MKIQLSIKLEFKRDKKEQPTEQAPEIVDAGSAVTEIRYQPQHIGFAPEEY